MFGRPRLRTILLIVNLLILSLPLGGIAVLRIYESALVRQTESELIAQGAFIATTYRAAFDRIGAELGIPNGGLARYGGAVSEEWLRHHDTKNPWRPRPASLDLATDAIHPPRPNTIRPEQTVDRLAAMVGREITPILREVQVVTLAGIRVTDHRGTIVASTGEAMGRSLVNTEEVRRALDGEYVSLLRKRLSDEARPPFASISRGAGIRVFVSTPIIKDSRVLGAVVLSRTPTSIANTLYGKRHLLMQLAIAMLAVVLIIALFTSLTITRPVRALIDQTRRAVRGQKGAVTPLAKPVTQEIHQLSQAVATMAETLEQRADYIRTFATHVSHEFKTPLTAIQGSVEILQDHFDTMSGEERRRFLSNLHEDAVRLDRLVRRLLELARADVVATGDETADVTSVVADVVDRYRRQGLTIDLQQQADGPRVAMSGEILDSILSNLIENARQHGGTGVNIQLGIDSQKQNGQSTVVFHVEDDGPGVSPANQPRIFEPFFTTSRSRGGTGLGLPVVKSLLLAHDSQIELLSPNTGMGLKITIPVSKKQR